MTRVLLFAPGDDAAEIVTALVALADTTDRVSWLSYSRRDGTESKAATLRIGDTTVDVAVGDRSLPAVLEVRVPDLPAALERVLVAGFSASTWPHEGELETVNIGVGGMRIRAVSEAALIDRRGV